MENMTVLVTSIGTPIAHGILKGLKEMGNIRIIGVDSRTLTAGNVFCDKVYRLPRFDQRKEAYFEKLKEVIEKENVQAIFPSHPQEISLYNDYTQHLSIPFALPQSDQYEKLADKAETYKLLEEKGLGKYLPTYYTFNSSAALKKIIQNKFSDEDQLVVKDTSGHGATGFALLTNHSRFLKAIEKQESRVFSFKDYLSTPISTKRMVMKNLEKPEYSVDVYVNDSETVVSVPRERTGVSNGLVLDGTVIEHTSLIAMSSEIAEAIIDEGFINLQFMKDDGNFLLTDVNPRFCGSQIMSLGAGVNFPELFLTYRLTDERPIPRPKWNTRMLRYRESVFYYDYTPEKEPDVWTATDD